MTFDEYEFRVADVFICALYYGDLSGLEQGDIDALNQFLENLPDGSWDVSSEEGSFATCDICGLGANCYDMRLSVPASDSVAG